MHKKYNIQMKYTKSVLWTSCVVILLRDVSIAQQHLWLWQSIALSIAFHSVCEHYPRCTCVIEWTHIELYDLSPINLRLWWMYHHLCGCDEVSPPLSLACSFGCIIPVLLSRPDKSGRARISGRLWKIARVTPGFLWFCPDFCDLVHVQSVIGLFAKRQNNALSVP